jgi:hypothetical protein
MATMALISRGWQDCKRFFNWPTIAETTEKGLQSDRRPGQPFRQRFGCTVQRNILVPIKAAARRCREYAFIRPSQCCPRKKCSLRYSCQFRPILQAVGLVSQRQPMIGALVPSLHVVRRPITILRKIVVIIVSSLHGMRRAWARPHISIELGKRLAPGLAYPNTTGAIIDIVRTSRAMASTNHIAPALIFGTVLHAVRAMDLAIDFSTQATTAMRQVSSQTCRVYCAYSPATTLAYPSRSRTRTIRRTSQYRPAIKWLSSEINEVVLRHDASLQAKGRWSGLPQVRLGQLAAREAPDDMTISEVAA